MAVSVLGTITSFDVQGSLSVSPVTIPHTVTVGTEALLIAYLTRVTASSVGATLGANWNTSENATQLLSNYDATALYEDVVSWVGIVLAPTSGAHDVKLSQSNAMRGGEVLCINLTGLDLTTPLGASTAQRQGTSSSAAVGPLTIAPQTAGGLIIARLAISLDTTLSSFTGTGYTTISNGKFSNADGLTLTSRYKVQSLASEAASAQFAAPDQDIGGIVFEIRASSTEFDKSGDISHTPVVEGAVASPSKASLAVADFLNARTTFTSVLVIRGNDTDVDRNLVRIGTPGAAVFQMMRKATGVISCLYRMDGGVVEADSFIGSLTTSVSTIALTHEAGDGGEIHVDGLDRLPSRRVNHALGGATQVTGALEIGDHSALLPSAFSGIMARWIIDSRPWSLRRKRLFHRCIAEPQLVWGQGEPNYAYEPNRGPVAIPTIVSIGGSPTLITPHTIDPDGTEPRLVAVGTPERGTATIDLNKIRYVPPVGYIGTDQFTYQVEDSEGKISSSWVSVNITASAIVAQDDVVTVTQNVALDISPLANDSGGSGPLTITAWSTPAHGTIASTATPGVLRYTPATDYLGGDSFSYTVSDGTSQTTGNVLITVSLSPTIFAGDDTMTTTQGTAVEKDVTVNDSPGCTVDSIVTQGAHGVASIKAGSGNKVIRYVPASGYTGADLIRYELKRAADDARAQANIAVQVNPVPVDGPYNHKVAFPNASAIDLTKIREWTPGNPWPSGYSTGDILVVVRSGPFKGGLSTPDDDPFKGPVVWGGTDMQPRPESFKANYSDLVVGRGPMMQPKFASNAVSHWNWGPGSKNWPFLWCANWRINSQVNACDFYDLMKVYTTNATVHDVNPRLAVFLQKCYWDDGVAYVSTTSIGSQDGHSDGIQCMGNIAEIYGSDLQMKMAGGQMFFAGAMPEKYGYPRTTKWRFWNCVHQHVLPFNSLVQIPTTGTKITRLPKLIAGDEQNAIPPNGENSDPANGKYLATEFVTQCWVQGLFPAATKVEKKAYIGPTAGMDLDSNNNYTFSTEIWGDHTFPMWAGLLKYIGPTVTTPSVCNPAHTGAGVRFLSKEDFIASIGR